MFLTVSEKFPVVDLLLDTTLSFEARSLYILIDSLAGDGQHVYAPSLTVLAATTNWPRSQVRRILTELIERQLVEEIDGHEGRYVIQAYVPNADKNHTPYHNSEIPEGTMKNPSPSTHNILSPEEISALLTGFC